MLWNDETVLEATGGVSNDMPFVSNGVCINTRDIKDGDLFVAINGGEKHLDDAFSKGAVCAIISETYEEEKTPSPLEGEGWGEGLKEGSHREYKAQFKSYARTLRHNQTEPEKIIWHFLRNSQTGCKFRRQHQISNKYIVDFICLKKNLIIEIDGETHSNLEDEKERSEYLESQGFEILRFNNKDIINNMEGCWDVLINKLNFITPHPDPLPQGEREKKESPFVKKYITDKPIITVQDTFEALRAMGQYKRKNTKAKYIAITGSVGKTGTKNMLADLLSIYGETYATSGNFNNHYGVPLTLANMPESTEFAVIELGMNHTGEISQLVKQVNPDVALITMIAECHMEFFDSIEDIAKAKTEIFESLNGTAVINKSSPCFDIMQKRAEKYSDKVLTFGDEESCDIKLDKCVCYENGSDVDISVKWEGKLSYYLPIPGGHIALNSCGVFAVLKALDVDLEKASKAIEKINTTEGRGEKTTVSLPDGQKITVIDETYNASPQSVLASVKKLSLIKEGRRILVLGDMLELGDKSKDLHLSIIPTILESSIDKVYCCGEFMKFVYQELPKEIQGEYAEDSGKLIPLIEKDLKNEDNILIKGSHGSKMDLIVNYLKGN